MAGGYIESGEFAYGENLTDDDCNSWGDSDSGSGDSFAEDDCDD